MLSGPVAPGTHLVRIGAGTAFGIGEHLSTADCLKAPAALDTAPGSVLDTCCGSAILSIAATHLWDSAIVAGDNDTGALAFARHLIARNNLTARPPCLHRHLARLRTRLLIAMTPALNTSTVILSGFLNDQAAPLLEACRQTGYTPRATIVIDD